MGIKPEIQEYALEEALIALKIKKIRGAKVLRTDWAIRLKQ